MTTQTITVPITGVTATDLLTISKAVSALSTGTITTSTPPPPSTALAIKVSGKNLIDQNGKIVLFKGVNVSGLEDVAMQGWDPNDPFGGQSPNFAALASWGINVIRLPLNEDSWLGLTTYDYPVAPATVGIARKADPGGNYQATVAKVVNAATAAGLYVILDLHITSPDAAVPGISGTVPTSAQQQNPMADASNSIAFWTSLASVYKSSPNVIFDLFNEPHIDAFEGVTGGADATAWSVWRNGGIGTVFFPGTIPAAGQNGGAVATVTQNWQSAGMQQLLNAVRATGATNVCMAAGVEYALNMSMWLKYKPADPLNQLVASWHGYPNPNNNTEPQISTSFADIEAILAAGYPVVMGETGDYVASLAAATWFPVVLPWAKANGVGAIAWTWNVWPEPQNVLITSSNGTPNAGEGTLFKAS
jgi:endoglucanase